MESFSFNTIENFDSHIAQSIPNYDLMVSSIIRLSDYFKDENKTVYDLGCSTGTLLKNVQKTYNGKMVGIDISKNLLPASNEGYPNIEFVEQDLTQPTEFKDACIIYSIFTMQFLPKECRKQLLQSIYNGLVPGGAFFFCEKVYNTSGMFQDMFTSSYYDYKRQSFTEKEIWDKERSLRTMLKPNTAMENQTALMSVGFSLNKMEMFYRYFNFTGVLCVK